MTLLVCEKLEKWFDSLCNDSTGLYCFGDARDRFKQELAKGTFTAQALIGDMDKQRFLAELRRLKQYYFDSCQPLSGTLMTICGQFIRRIEDGEFDPAQADGGLAGGLLDSLKRIADMKDRDGNSIEMTAQELQGIARRAIACHENTRPSHSGWQPMETAPMTDDEEQPTVWILQGGRRFLAEWDPAAGHWQGIHAIDGVERERYYQEWPGRLYSPDGWQPLPSSPEVKP